MGNSTKSRLSVRCGAVAIVSLAAAIAAGCGQPTAPAAAPAPAATSTKAAVPAAPQFEVVRAAADAYLSSEKTKTPNIKAADLYAKLNDGDKSNDPILLCVQQPADYVKGHIPGAINIPWTLVFKPENLAKLPTDRKIVVYCYTGHTGSQVTALLNAAGYDATNLHYGISAWTRNREVAPSRFNDAESKDYPFVTGPNPF